tara:strand:- start:4600 stop:5397 length:798 start_codon:yes stop_codon:yes gene_type:complete
MSSKPKGFHFVTESPIVPGVEIINIIRFSGGNTKTGRLVDTWHFVKGVSFHKARHNGAYDRAICGDCNHRPKEGQLQGTCYVTGLALLGMEKSFDAGNYPHWTTFGDDLQQVLAFAGQGRTVRMGQYGDPVVMGEDNVLALVSLADSWAGYSHQWSDDQFAWAVDYMMASADTPEEMVDADAKGWRCFVPHSPDMETSEALTKVRAAGLKALKCPTEAVKCNACPVKCSGKASTTKHHVLIKAHGAPNILKQYRASDAQSIWLEA